MLVLAIESSTSSAKALLYDSEKGVVDSIQQSYGPIWQDGKTDTQKVYELTMQMANHIAAGKDIASIALCGTWHSMAVCDQKLNPVSPTYSWDFKETSVICEEMRKDEDLTDRIYRTTGCMPHNTYPRHALMYLKKQGMDLSDKLFITQGAYNFYQLTGEYEETPCTQSGSGLINLESLEYDDFILDYIGIRKDQLGRLVTYKDIRPLNENGAKILGLPAGIPVVPAHADGALNQVGNYANRKGIMTLSVGTSGAIRVAATHSITPAERQLWCYYGVDKWMSGAAISGACNCINWFMGTLQNGGASFAEMEQMEDENASVPTFLPFLYGERCPGWNDDRRGGFQFVESNHTLKEFYKGLQMGILYNLYQCYQIICREGEKPEQIIVSGGIINSERWTQMVADIFEQDILVASCPNASSMGAVALALHAAGALDDVNSFEADFSSARQVTCQTDKFDYYREHFAKYMKAYQDNLN